MDPWSRGPLFSSFLRFHPESWIGNAPLSLKHASTDCEVYFAPKLGMRKESMHLLFTEDIVAQLALTGIVNAIEPAAIQRQAAGNYHVSEELCSGSDPESVLKEFVSCIEAAACNIDTQVVSYEQTEEHFQLFNAIRGRTGIVPDASASGVFVRAGEGCPYSCAFCGNAGSSGFFSHSIADYAAHVEDTHSRLEDILGEGIAYLEDGFILVPDILYLDKGELTPSLAAEILRDNFPMLRKIGAFIGVGSVLKKDASRASKEYFRELANKGYGISRLYMGIETGHTDVSMLIGKPFSYEQKRAGARIVQKEIPLKAIVQVGLIGQGCCLPGKGFVSSSEAITRTAQLIREIRPYRLMISIYQETHARTPPEYSHAIRPYPDYAQGVQNEILLLNEELGFYGWEDPSRIEPDYEQFLPLPEGAPFARAVRFL